MRELTSPKLVCVVRGGEGIVDYQGERNEDCIPEVVDWAPTVAGVGRGEVQLGWVETKAGESHSWDSTVVAELAVLPAQITTSTPSGGPEHSLQWNTSRWE